MKVCIACNEPKPTDSFYRHPASADGLLHVCKDCHKTRMKVRRLTDPLVQQRDTDRAPMRRKQRQLNVEKWRKEYPNGYRAHNALNNAVRDKKITKQPCALCGTEEHIHAVQRDYAKPLDVVWLCAKCHKRILVIFPELAERRR